MPYVRNAIIVIFTMLILRLYPNKCSFMHRAIVDQPLSQRCRANVRPAVPVSSNVRPLSGHCQANIRTVGPTQEVILTVLTQGWESLDRSGAYIHPYRDEKPHRALTTSGLNLQSTERTGYYFGTYQDGRVGEARDRKVTASQVNPSPVR